MTRKVVKIATACALVGLGWACSPVDRPPPNIIVILVDTLRADHLGVYGFDGDVSPNLDAFAAESVIFRSCFSQSPWTKPAVASMFTSLYPQVHGLTNHEGKYWGRQTPGARTGVLPEEAETLAERLRAEGYRTGAFVSNPWVAVAYGFDQGFDLFHEEELGLRSTADQLVDDATAWLDSLEGDEPYFLYLHFMDVHAPYEAPHEDYLALEDSPSVRSKRRLTDRERPEVRWHNIEVPADWADESMRSSVSYWRTRYASGVRAFDRRLGRFVAGLRERGELRRSLLVVTSDHGEELFEHGDWSHGQNLFDHQLHVPLLIRNPGGRAGGVETSAFVELVDLMPTLLTVVGADPPEGLQGRDLSGALAGDEIADPAVTFATATQRTPGLYSVRTPRDKLIFDVLTDRAMLFDLRADPGEQRELLAAQVETAQEGGELLAARAEKALELRDRLRTHIRESVAGGTLRPGSAEIPQELRERLEALGYLR